MFTWHRYAISCGPVMGCQKITRRDMIRACKRIRKMQNVHFLINFVKITKTNTVITSKYKRKEKNIMNKEESENKKEKKDEYKVIRTFSEDGPTFQEVMEKIILNKLWG